MKRNRLPAPWFGLLIGIAACLPAGPATAQALDGLAAGQEAAARADFERRLQVAEQRALVIAIPYRLADPFPLLSDPFFGPDAIVGRWSLWPYQPIESVPHPIDQVLIQTGPDRWESWPVYSPPYPPPLAAPRAREF